MKLRFIQNWWEAEHPGDYYQDCFSNWCMIWLLCPFCGNMSGLPPISPVPSRPLTLDGIVKCNFCEIEFQVVQDEVTIVGMIN
jgi:hypothetical protein